MLLVKTYIALSNIPDAGLGCFADQDITKGEKIWELNPLIDRIFSEKNLDTFSDLEKSFIKRYAYKHRNLYYLCIDNAKFFNHSEEHCNTIDPENEYCTYAARDIKKGEEIFSNYYHFGSTNEDLEFNNKMF